MNKNPFEYALNKISTALVEQGKTTPINVQAFGRKDADEWMYYFYQFEGEFKDAKANGICKRYNESGALINDGIFLDGNPIVIYDYSYNKTVAWFYLSNGEILEKELPVDFPRLRKIKSLKTLEL